MQNTFLSSNYSRKCNGSLSFSSYCSNDSFCRHHYEYVSQLPVYSPSSSCLVSCCYSCCANANLSMNKVPATPVYLCGLRQSSLIQCISSKRVIFSGWDRGVSRLSGFDVNRRSNIEKGGIFRERGWGKGTYRWMVYEESGEEFGMDNEAEVMLSLLSEEVSEDCLDVRRRNGRRGKKVIVEERGNGDDQCTTCGSRKKVSSGSLRNSLKVEYESGVSKARDEDGDMAHERSEEENVALLRKGHQMVSARRREKDELLRGRLRKEERDVLLRESRKKENEDTLIKNHRLSAMKERREDLLRREEHRRKVKKDGSSCSSYYSLASMGEFESDSEIHEKKEEFEEKLSSKFKRDSGRLEEIELDEKDERHGGYQEEQKLILKKGKRVEGNELNWHKESEKKLTDMSTEETKFCKESNVHDVEARKASYKEYEVQEEKATSMVKSNQGRREHRHTSDEVTETINNYKQFKENSERYGATLTSSSDSLPLHNQGEGIFTAGSSSVKETKKEHYNIARLQREEEYKKISKHTQLSDSQNLNISKTSSSGIVSETKQNDQEKGSKIILSSDHDAMEKYYHHGLVSTQIDSSITSQQSTEEIDHQRATISQRKSEHNIRKQEDSSSSVYGSYYQSIKNIQTNEGYGKSDSKMIMEKRNDPLLGNDGGSGSNDAYQPSRSKYDYVMTPKLSQPVASDALHAGSTSGLVIKEGGNGSSHEDSEHETSEGSRKDETYDQPVGFISQEDSLASAGLLHRSSAYHVGEFMEKVRHEMSSSEIQMEKQAHEMKTGSDPTQYEQQSVTEVVSGGLELKEQDSKSKHSSPSSGSKGPSVEMWDVHDPSTQEHPGAEVLDRKSVDSNLTKRTGRSLWNVMADIVRFRWGVRSTNQSQMSKSGEKSSPNQSTTSEAWFSGNEPDENIQEADKKRKGSVSQESISVKIPKEEKGQSRGSSHSSSLKDQIQPVERKPLSYADVGVQGLASGNNSSSSGEQTSHQQSEGLVSGSSMIAVSSQSPAIKLRRSPYVVGERPASGKVDASGGGKIVQIDVPVPIAVTEISQPKGKDVEQQSRKLLRTTQVVRDRFEEWEEAYRIEAKQRNVDEMFMREALIEARKAADNWEVPVGAVLVHDGKIIARGHNLVEELRDSTAHAEMICIRNASNVLRSWRLSETILYVTLEPCAMCAGAILQARIDVVVWGAPNKLLGADGSWIRLFPSGEGDHIMNTSDKAAAPVHPFHPNIQIRRNVLASECADSMQQFFKRRRKKNKQQEPPTSSSTAPSPRLVIHPSKILTKMHDAFHMMFCL